MRIQGWLLHHLGTFIHGNHWFELIDTGKDICAYSLINKKAFDTVPHRPLFEKLVALNLNRHMIQWIADYLTLRTQQAVVEGETSKSADVLSGVHQGSVLGPLLFLVYIDEVGIISLFPESEQVMFADDLLLYRPISTKGIPVVQDDITNIEDWSIANYLTLKKSKCKYMIISRKRAPLLPEFTLMLNGQVLEQVDIYKYLGILLSKDLSWSPHIDAVCTKARKILGLLYSPGDFTSSVTLMYSDSYTYHL